VAEKRMFTKAIIDSDAFLEMPLSTQALYFHLNMRADDDGFINNPMRITSYVNASADDLKILLAKRFIIRFDSGVIVIKHWRMHNTLRSDRYHPTDYQDELSLLCVKENKSYTEKTPEFYPSSTQPEQPERLPSGCQSGNHGNRGLGLGLGLGLDLEEVKEASNDASCAEPEKSASTPPVISLILHDNSYFDVTNDDYVKWKELYPAVDVMQELRKMAGWCDSNKTKRKTRRGVRAFITAWLAREQDKGGSSRKTTQSLKNAVPTEYGSPEDFYK